MGQVGDGKFHMLLLLDADDPSERARAVAFIDWLNDLAIEMEGTCTGEHWVGQGKMLYLEREPGGATRLMRAIKKSLDPRDGVNPGKTVRV